MLQSGDRLMTHLFMTKRANILFLAAMMLAVGIQGDAQTLLSGRVVTSGGRAVDMANIVVASYTSPKYIFASTFTEENGSYSLTVSSDCDSLLLRATSLEIEPTVIKIPNQSGLYDIIVEDRAIELKEVVVKSKKIYSHGDTVNYNVANFLAENDKALADVLKKMPGITVTDAGQVSYQDKPIKNFYIEGLDLMKSHYGIATNNLDPNNIATVQILENHQDIKALKGLRPEEQASINIRLKEGVRGVFNLIATLGGGYGKEALWDDSAMATYFKRSSQLLSTYKGNNTGEDLSQELYSFDNDYSRTSNIANISMPSAPGIDKRFYYFNRSHSATFNNVYRIGKVGELGINAAYLNDHDSRQSYSTTANSLPDGMQNIVDELMRGEERTDKAYGDLTYLHNGDTRYLKEQLKFDWSSADTKSGIRAGDDDIAQNGATESLRLFNKFHFTNRSSEYRGYEVYSTLNIEKRPHSLSVSPNLFPNLLDGNFLRQEVDYRNISTDNRAGLLSACMIGNVALHPSMFVNFQHNSLTSALGESRNDVYLNCLAAGIATEIAWNTRNFHASLYIPVGYRRFSLKDRAAGIASTRNLVRIEPQLDFSYKLGSCHNLGLKSSINYSMPEIQNLYSKYILTSYRTLSAYDFAGLFEGINLHTSLSYTFRDIFAMRFASMDLSWNRQKPEVLYGSYYDGLVSRMTSRPTRETSDILSAQIRGSHGFDWKRMKIGISTSYSYYTSPLLVQNSVIRYSGNAIGVKGDLSLSPMKWLSVAYAGEYYQSSSRQEGFERMPWIRTMTNEATFDFTLTGGIGLRTSLYHYYNSFNDGDKSFLLLNVEATYSIKRMSFTLSCDNLFNRKEYVYSSRTALTESCSIYRIRPRSILLNVRFRIL